MISYLCTEYGVRSTYLTFHPITPMTATVFEHSSGSSKLDDDFDPVVQVTCPLPDPRTPLAIQPACSAWSLQTIVPDHDIVQAQCEGLARENADWQIAEGKSSSYVAASATGGRLNFFSYLPLKAPTRFSCGRKNFCYWLA
jgi:hypothetical protein